MDRITRLRIFDLLAKTLSFTGTAAAMSLSRSTVTKAVNELEVELGTRLLDRTTRSASLTLDGTAFLDRCRAALDAYDEAHAMFAAETRRPRGRVRVSMPSRIGRRVVAPALPRFIEAYPEVQLEICASDRQTDLIREGFDCVLRVGEKDDSELVARKLADLPMATVASPDYIARRGLPRTVRDLDGHVAVAYAPRLNERSAVWADVIDGAPVRVELPRTVTATTAEMYIACAKAGLGLIDVPAFDVRDALEDGTLIQALPDATPSVMPMALVYAHRRNMIPRVRVFVDWMSELIRDVAAHGVAPNAQDPAEELPDRRAWATP
ncbi:MAG: LysR family transcriptional regulator [Pseudomonadota bacterium]